MRLKDHLDSIGLNIPNEILVLAANHCYPDIENKGWSKEEISDYILYIDLESEDIIKIIISCARFAKVWMFS